LDKYKPKLNFPDNVWCRSSVLNLIHIHPVSLEMKHVEEWTDRPNLTIMYSLYGLRSENLKPKRWAEKYFNSC